MSVFAALCPSCAHHAVAHRSRPDLATEPKSAPILCCLRGNNIRALHKTSGARHGRRPDFPRITHYDRSMFLSAGLRMASGSVAMFAVWGWEGRRLLVGLFVLAAGPRH